MDEELKALHDKQTWEVINPSKNANIVGCKWVYTCKRDSAGRFIHAKSQLVAQGFTQMFSVDYYETYSPIVHLTSLRLICAIATCNNWPIHQMDVDTAYLNANLKVPIYMCQLPGYNQGTQDSVLLLEKCLWTQAVRQRMVQVSMQCFGEYWLQEVIL